VLPTIGPGWTHYLETDGDWHVPHVMKLELFQLELVQRVDEGGEKPSR